MTAVGAVRFWLAGSDGEDVAEDGHRAGHRPKAGSLVGFRNRYEGGALWLPCG
jgi:hypothetical protein